ncbi:MAG: M48 family peptidase [Rhodospirillales bacterium]|nr:M48 family peptidase [Rhodospirillales bacterium]
MRRRRDTKRESAKVYALEIEGAAIPLRLRRSRRARRITLNIDLANDGAVVTLPLFTAEIEGLDLARREAAWIVRRLAALPPRLAFADGAVVPLRGIPHRIRHAPGTRGSVWAEGGAICVSGKPEHLARRVRDWLKREARATLTDETLAKADGVGRTVKRISVRDTRSLWGSCAASGAISFCWRLIFVPDFVRDYVVAHEVAHLIEKNHGPRFWQLVATLTGEMVPARAWLKRHGEALHRLG